MADVRGASGVPVVGNFSGVQTPSPSTPIYVNTANGDAYVLINESVVQIASPDFSTLDYTFLLMGA